jgi:hypothetical protein
VARGLGGRNATAHDGARLACPGEDGHTDDEPALDITTTADIVRPTDKIRCASARDDPSGGGIDVERFFGVADVDVAHSSAG